MTEENIQRTPLHDCHLALGARMAPFGGFEMPIQYKGIVAEHQTTRNAVTVFDTCHMGEFQVSGVTAAEDLERLVSCDIASLQPGRCRYGMICNKAGGVLDDLLVYRVDANEFMLVVNAGTQERDFAWIVQHLSADTIITNISARTGKIDLQGPDAPRMARSLLDDDIENMVFYSFRNNGFDGAPVLVSRTGYTGEAGFEFYAPPGITVQLWNACLEAGASPAGLGARDTLRLEMGMPLYGHELSAERNAGEAGFTRAVSTDKEFIGSAAVHGKQNQTQSLCGIAFPGRRAAREGDLVLNAYTGESIGQVTSGSFAPSLGHAVALAYVDNEVASCGLALRVKHGRKELEGTITDLPFYKEGTARKKLSRFLS